MARYDPPEKFSFKAEEWPEWIEEFERFRKATKLHYEDGEVQRDSLIYCMGKKANQIFKTLKFVVREVPDPNDNTKTVQLQEKDTDYDTVVEKLTAYFIPKRNIIHERSLFQERVQSRDETVEEFSRALQSLVEHCDYKDPDDQVRDRLVVGLRDSNVKQKLQLTHDLTLTKAIDIARQYEQVKQQLAQQQHNDAAQVNEARAFPKGKQKRPKNHPKSQQPQTQKLPQRCERCGYDKHPKSGKCPASGQVCKKCNRFGHFASVCRTKPDGQSSQRHATHAVSVLQSPQESEEGAYFLGAVNGNSEDDPWYVNLEMCGTSVKFKIDSGADVTVISSAVWKSLKTRPKLEHTCTTLDSAGGSLKVNGKFQCSVKHKGSEFSFPVIVIEGSGSVSLLARGVSHRMGLIRYIGEVADGKGPAIGLLKTTPVQIQLKDGATPHCVHSARKVPLPLMDKVKAELERMVENDIIRPVTEPTEWCAAMVPVPKKSGAIRICVDLKKLNKAVRREHFTLPVLSDIAPKLAGSRYFTKLDAASGFWQIPLDEKSQLLTTFMTPYGRYAFKRVPFGITSAPEIFQRKIMEVVTGLDGVETIMDDLLIYGKTLEQHDVRLKKVMVRLHEAGLRLNLEKCEFRAGSLTYFGHVVSEDGIRPDPEKVKAITEMSPPCNVKEARSVIGLFQYVGKFIPNLSTVMKPVTDLLKDDVSWYWGPAQQEAFETAKRLVCTAPTLVYYEPDKPLVVSADASSFGLGGVLMQEHGPNDLRPVAFCSRTLTSAEQNYAQIEKECLASVWACEKFAKYLVGLETFALWTDHKPLVPLMSTKDIDQAPIRCQRLLIRMMRFNPSVVYVPGRDQTVSDALSRKPQATTVDEIQFSEEVQAHVDSVMQGWPVSTSRLQVIKQATEDDDELRAVTGYVMDGWPRKEDAVPAALRPYYHARAELSVADGVVVFQNRIVIPSKMQAEILGLLHESHQGISKCRDRARMTVWWPFISRDIKTMIDKCSVCRQARPTQQEQPLKPIELPQYPWQQLGTDLMEFQKKTYLVVIDYYSRWIEVKHLTSTTSKAVIDRLKSMFVSFGIPQTIISDNGPQFGSQEFQNFMREWGVCHKTSNPYTPQENGMAERAVQTVKGLLRLENPELGLLNYRATPHSATGVSPAKALFGRELNTKMPILTRQLLPRSPDMDGIRQSDQNAKAKYKQYYDSRKGAKPLCELKPGEPVLVKLDHEPQWNTSAKVVQGDMENHSYVVQTEDGAAYRRNRKHIQPVPDMDTGPAKSMEPVIPSEVINQPGDSEPSLGPVGAKVSTQESNPGVGMSPMPVRSSHGRVIRPPRRLCEEC